jgi:ubiquinone/menaquinone biosynthesis C-methylase UbiE
MVDHLFEDTELAALYDLMNPREVRADFDFYLPMVMAAGAVLDVGCGTGAMLHEARAAGHAGRLCGLDPAAGMLARARARGDIEWVQGDLASTAWEAEFDLVVMTGHAFQALVEDEEIRAALEGARAALTSDGVFAFETRNPTAWAWEAWTSDRSMKIGDTGARMARQVVQPFDGRTVSFTHTFSHPDWPEPRVSRSTLRFLSVADLASRLADAGLMIQGQYGDWDRSAVSEASPEIITIVRRG